GAEFKAERSDHAIEVEFLSVAGHPFTYGPSYFTGGTLASIQVNLGSPLTFAYKFSGMSLPVTTVGNDIDRGNYAAALNLIFGGNDVITGSNGGDRLGGFGGNDNINGGAGADILNGMAGNDRLTGGAGNDRETGGPGNDTFVFTHGAGKDAVNDF